MNSPPRQAAIVPTGTGNVGTYFFKRKLVACRQRWGTIAKLVYTLQVRNLNRNPFCATSPCRAGHNASRVQFTWLDRGGDLGWSAGANLEIWGQKATYFKWIFQRFLCLQRIDFKKLLETSRSFHLNFRSFFPFLRSEKLPMYTCGTEFDRFFK